VLQLQSSSARVLPLVFAFPLCSLPMSLPAAPSLQPLAVRRGKPINVADYEADAAQHLQKQVYDYYRSGANDEVTLKENVAAYNRLIIRPRFLVDVSEMDRQFHCADERRDGSHLQ
jgi:predicted component of type VI protein secretion system